METALTALLVKGAMQLTRETQSHSNGCRCELCITLFALWLSLGSEGRASLNAQVWDSFPACPVASDLDVRREDDLLSVAIRQVIERHADELPDISDQVVQLILSDDTFAPLRERIYRSLFSFSAAKGHAQKEAPNA